MQHMGTQVPSGDEAKEQASSNLGPGAVGGAGVLGGTMLLGPTLGPIAGGILAGSTQTEETKADIITLNGMMMGFQSMGQNLTNGASSNSGGSTQRM